MPTFSKGTIAEIRDRKVMDNNGDIINHEMEEIGQFFIETYPLGFRGVFKKIRGLRKVLYSVPYITGSVPKFRLIVEHTSNTGNIPFTIFISQERDGEPMPSIPHPIRSMEARYIIAL